MKKGILYTILLYLALSLASCSATKFVPDGSYLLDEVKIHTDNKEIKPSDMRLYVRQNPNSKWFSKPSYMYIIGPDGILQNGSIDSCVK